MLDVNGGLPESQCHLLLPGLAPFHLLEFDGLPSEHVEYFQHEGFEAVYVIAGRVEIDISADLTTLAPGDSMSYPASLPHRVRSVGKRRARVLLIETMLAATRDPCSAEHVR